jgi:hypothetical protein
MLSSLIFVVVASSVSAQTCKYGGWLVKQSTTALCQPSKWNGITLSPNGMYVRFKFTRKTGGNSSRYPLQNHSLKK